MELWFKFGCYSHLVHRHRQSGSIDSNSTNYVKVMASNFNGSSRFRVHTSIEVYQVKVVCLWVRSFGYLFKNELYCIKYTAPVILCTCVTSQLATCIIAVRTAFNGKQNKTSSPL